jgi:Ca2+-transporting ATPase
MEPEVDRVAPTTGDARAAGEDAWHALSLDQVYERVAADASGLSSNEAAARLEAYGPNEIERAEPVDPLAIFVGQFRDVLIYVLVGAALLSVGVGVLPGVEPGYTDAGLILVILLLNGLFGFAQDYRAERSIEALRAMSAPEATVVRDGDRTTVDATKVVPGDMLVLESGDAVPADARLVEANDLAVDESALTGESSTVSKTVGEVEADCPLAERSNVVYTNSSVVRGRGRAVVTETGMQTEVGDIATEVQGAETRETPFQAEVDELGRRIGAGVVALVVVVAAVQLLLTDTRPLSVLLVGVTLAVAAVPEGLPAVVTLTLALGSRRMADRSALVRRLSVVESLGAIDTILTDKTGTLTESRMTVTRVFAGDESYTLGSAETNGRGEFDEAVVSDDPVAPGHPDDIDADAVAPVLRCGALCNDATQTSAGEYRGDPTEVALLRVARERGVDPGGTRVAELPFSAERKRMTVVVDEGEATVAYTKGAPEVVLERCSGALVDGERVEMDDERRERVRERVSEFAGDALRVLAFASKPVENPEAEADDLESGLTFLGLQGMIDPPRAEVAGAVADCHAAGIDVTMVTGDDVETARAVAAAVGVDPEGALTGREIDRLSDTDLEAAVEEVRVFARATPTQKVRILGALRAGDHLVAMTGDGVNDAPALRTADVGIAMGQRGTDVARAASDMILLDDNFATIRDAVAEGRAIFDNIRKFVNYLLSANAGEVLAVFVGVLIGTALFPALFAARAEALILTPVMLLWINLVTDGLPALALGADPAAEGILDRPPRATGGSVISRRMAASIAAIGVVMAATGLGLFFIGLRESGSIVRAQTLLFTFLVVVEVVRIQVIRARYGLSVGSNRWLVAAVLVTLVLQLVVLYTPLNALFEVDPLPTAAWEAIGVGFLVFVLFNLAAAAAFDRGFPDEE